MAGKYPIALLVIEAVEAVAIIALIYMVIKLWQEVEVPESTE